MDTKLLLECPVCHAHWEARGNAGKVWEGIGLPVGLKPCSGSPWHGYRFAKGKLHKPCTGCPGYGIIVTKLGGGGYDRKECPTCNGTGYGEVVG